MFSKPARPFIVRRSPAGPHGSRMAKYRGDTGVEGRKYEVLEQIRQGYWVVVTVLTILNGRRQHAA